jgi:S-DNA-T family DNA segregation ATPase FtsK/SpoIIIE
MMEKAGIIGPADGARPREILVDEEEAEEMLARLRGNG